MNRFSKFLVAAFMSAAMALPNMAQSMDIIQFDLMTAQDRQGFIDFLPQAAETVLKQEGRSDDAAKVHQLFNAFSSGSNLPLGVGELEMNLANQRVRNVQQHIKNPDASQLQVESALALTLSKNGIQVTPDFVKALMQLTGTFHPQSPPRNQ
jgi:hypothetical protein